MFGSFPRIVVIRITFPVDVVFYLVDENNESVPTLMEINSLFTFPSGEVLLLRIESTINSDLIWSRSISNHKNIEFVLTFVFINLLSHTHTHTQSSVIRCLFTFLQKISLTQNSRQIKRRKH